MNLDTLGHGRRLPRTLGILLVLLVLAAPAFRLMNPATARAADDAPLDLATLVLTPSDLEAVGLEGFGVADGESRSPEEIAAAVAFQRGTSLEETDALFAEAGLRQAYEMRLEEPAGADEPGACGCARSATSTIYEFADEARAADGLAVLTDRGDVATVEEVETGVAVGDDAVLARQWGTTAEPFFALDLTFQAGSLVIVVRLADFTGDEPAIADLEQLAEQQLERIEAGIEDAATGANGETLRLAGDGVMLGWDYYTLAGDEFRRSSRSAPEDAAGEAEKLLDAGMTIEFMVSQRIPTSGLVATDTYTYTIVEHFASADDASNFLHGELDRAAENDQFDDFAVLDDLAEYGDESIAFSQTYYWAAHDVDLVYQTYYLRVGDKLAMVTIIAPNGLPVTVLETLAAAQAACLEEGGCAGAAPLPDELQAMVEAAKGDDDLAPAGRQAEALPPGEEIWVSETFGAELTYQTAEWKALPVALFEGLPHTNGGELLALIDSEDRSVLTLEVFAGSDGVDECIEAQTAENAVSEERGYTRPVLDESGEPIAGGDGERAYLAYGVLQEDGSQSFAYAECRSFADGEALVFIFHVGPLAEYEERSAAREALLDGLDLPDE